ncbi:hypothetical protein C7451_108138 [Blastomonas natatoria]|uniref:DUF429 domain-containing protein n=1 Tax=Blastomonas natatoria TaxID=34015 RepID=A0A2V3UYI0_9SPHN|nr:hypothetical protein [Blastomonas natatoria]PXW74476.1 hypothetical protein C7451_108138 [Blastomonas natatoria]
MRRFQHYACFDWSGQAVARPKGLALATIAAAPGAQPVLVRPPGGWSRAAALEWLLDLARAGTDILIGLDLSPTFPFIDADGYFPGWDHSPGDARELWALVDRLCSGDDHLAASSFVQHAEARRYFRHGKDDTGDRFGSLGTGRLRAVEHHQRKTRQANSASCFNLVGAAQVGKSSLTGMRVLNRLAGRIPIWPFDPVPQNGPVIVEIYTSIAARAAGIAGGRSKVRDAAGLHQALAALDTAAPAPLAAHDDHSTDAIITAAWLRHAARDPELWQTFWHPAALDDTIRRTEGWTFGVK